ncbi:MAG: hypothetical protein IPG46_18420 [Actinobacteria bacterium]|nr:hypothetical protein [Actinomycetota bacterium]
MVVELPGRRDIDHVIGSLGVHRARVAMRVGDDPDLRLRHRPQVPNRRAEGVEMLDGATHDEHESSAGLVVGGAVADPRRSALGDLTDLTAQSPRQRQPFEGVRDQPDVVGEERPNRTRERREVEHHGDPPPGRVQRERDQGGGRQPSLDELVGERESEDLDPT